MAVLKLAECSCSNIREYLNYVIVVIVLVLVLCA